MNRSNFGQNVFVLLSFLFLLSACGGGGSSGGGVDPGAGGAAAGTGTFDPATATYTFNLTSPVTVAPASGPPPVTDGGTVTVRVTVRDAGGNFPPSGTFVTVTPSPNVGTVIGDSNSDGVPETEGFGGTNTAANGVATFSYRADNEERGINLTVSLGPGTPTSVFRVIVDDGFDFDSATVTITGPSPISLNSTRQYTATILDGGGNPPPTSFNAQFNVSPIGGGGVVSPNNVNIDANGQGTFNFTAPNNAGTTTVRARVSQDGTNKDGTIAIQYQQDVFQFTSPANNSTVTVGTPQNMSFQWQVAGQGATTGQPLGGSGANASQITLNVSGGGGGGGFIVGGVGPQNPATVDAFNGGFAQAVQIAANTTGGAANVTATANGGFSNTLNLNFVGAPAQITVTPTNPTINSAQIQQFTVTVRDGANNPLSGINVTFQIDTCAGGGTPACPNNERFQPVTVNTNTNGQATSNYFSGNAGNAALQFFVTSNNSVQTFTAITVN